MLAKRAAISSAEAASSRSIFGNANATGLATFTAGKACLTVANKAAMSSAVAASVGLTWTGAVDVIVDELFDEPFDEGDCATELAAGSKIGLGWWAAKSAAMSSVEATAAVSWTATGGAEAVGCVEMLATFGVMGAGLLAAKSAAMSSDDAASERDSLL